MSTPMSTPLDTPTLTGSSTPVAPVTFPRVLHAEWIKLWSLRSTYWTVIATLLAMALVAVLMSVTTMVTVDGETAQPDGSMAIGLGYSFAQIVVAVLGTLLITGEYSTGMIRSTLAAVPRRIPALGAKCLLIAVLGFVLGVLGVALSYLVSYPILGGDAAADLGDPAVQRLFWGTGLYLAGVGLLGLGVGAIVRHTAGAITITLGVLLMLSTFVQLLAMASDWFLKMYAYLPTVAGERMAAPETADAATGAVVALGPWTGFAVFMGYVVLTLVVATVLLRRRDA